MTEIEITFTTKGEKIPIVRAYNAHAILISLETGYTNPFRTEAKKHAHIHQLKSFSQITSPAETKADHETIKGTIMIQMIGQRARAHQS